MIAALLSWVPKAVGFVAMVRALTAVISVDGPDDPLVRKAVMISWVIAAATMTLGNTVALLQNNLKRLLAYSSIAHAGYLMIGVTAAFANEPRSGTLYYGCESIFFYLVAYALMTLGAFGVIIALRIGGRPVETTDELAGLASTQPLPALAMAICLLSLSGIPPLAGFWGKLQIFAAALGASTEDSPGAFVLLTVIGVLNAAVGAYYYLRIVVLMYFRPAKQKVEVHGGWPVAWPSAHAPPFRWFSVSTPHPSPGRHAPRPSPPWLILIRWQSPRWRPAQSHQARPVRRVAHRTDRRDRFQYNS